MYIFFNLSKHLWKCIDAVKTIDFVYVSGMVFILSRISFCQRSANSIILYSRHKLLLLDHLRKAEMGDSAQSVEKTKPKVFVTRSDFPQNGIDLLQKKLVI